MTRESRTTPTARTSSATAAPTRTMVASTQPATWTISTVMAAPARVALTALPAPAGRDDHVRSFEARPHPTSVQGSHRPATSLLEELLGAGDLLANHGEGDPGRVPLAG